MGGDLSDKNPQIALQITIIICVNKVNKKK